MHSGSFLGSISKALLLLALITVSALSADSAFARRQREWPVSTNNGIHGQSEIIALQEQGRGADYVEMHNVIVVRQLRDDDKGNRHQRWMVQLVNGRTLMAVYNISICERVPLREGDVISMGGQYIYDRSGGLLHWLHEDPRGRRPHGWVEVNGTRYGRVVRPH